MGGVFFRMKWYARLANFLLRGFSSSMRTSYGERSYTASGEFVRSKGEKRVADWLRSQGFKYDYEKELSDGRFSSKNKKYWPDFTVYTSSGKKVYVEYMGMYDNFPDYRKKYAKKADDYKKAGYNVVYLKYEDLNDLDDLLKPYLLI
jgi:predicted nuclease of restriction endonuclease-like RecB superfamily